MGRFHALVTITLMRSIVHVSQELKRSKTFLCFFVLIVYESIILVASVAARPAPVDTMDILACLLETHSYS